jgi:biotin carboxylase
MVGAGVEQVPAIKRARQLGLFVVALDGNPNAPGFAFANDHGIVSTYDPAGAVRFARAYAHKRPIDGVMTIASDVPITVSAVAKALGLPGHSIATARSATDKLRMKRVLRKHRIAIPAFAPIKTIGDAKVFARKHGYPVVVKPVDSRGARGVSRVKDVGGLAAAVRRARAESPSKRVMIEQFLAGSQFSTESVIYDGRIVTTGLSDRNYEYLERFTPHIIENGGQLPAELSREQCAELDRILVRSARALGIKRGTIKGDVVWTSRGPAIIEVAARLSGGYFATDSVPLSTGVHILDAAIRIALGQKPDFASLRPHFKRGVCQRFFFPPRAGKIQRIDGARKARGMPHVARFSLYAKPGDIVKSVTSHPARLGFVTTCARSRAAAIVAAEKAIEAVKFVVL